MCSNFMKFGIQNKLNMPIMNILLRTDDPDPKLQIWANLVPKLKCALTFMKFGSQSKSNMPIMNILLGNDNLDKTLLIRANLVSKF